MLLKELSRLKEVTARGRFKHGHPSPGTASLADGILFGQTRRHNKSDGISVLRCSTDASASSDHDSPSTDGAMMISSPPIAMDHLNGVADIWQRRILGCGRRTELPI